LITLIAIAPLIRCAILLGHPDVLTSPYVTLATNQPFLESFYDNLHTRYDALLVGVLAAHLHFSNNRVIQELARDTGASNLAMLISVTGILLMMSLPLEHMHDGWPGPAVLLFHLLHRPLFALLVAVLMLAALHGNGMAALARKMLASRLLLPFGQLAYSMYLFHIPIVILVHLLIKTHINQGSAQFAPEQLWLLAGLSLIPSSMFAAFVYLAVEKPVMNIRDRFLPANADKRPIVMAYAG
jgi:peptidoglycan/LPS O-acetylase OafA/YrhL